MAAVQPSVKIKCVQNNLEMTTERSRSKSLPCSRPSKALLCQNAFCNRNVCPPPIGHLSPVSQALGTVAYYPALSSISGISRAGGVDDEFRQRCLSGRARLAFFFGRGCPRGSDQPHVPPR